MKQKVREWLSESLIIVFACLIIFAVLYGYGKIGNRWYLIVSVKANSMAPTIHANDDVLVIRPDGLKVDDVVLLSVDGKLVTHRIVELTEASFKTKGDANTIRDDWSQNQVFVVGVVRCVFRGMGKFNLKSGRQAGAYFLSRDTMRVSLTMENNLSGSRVGVNPNQTEEDISLSPTATPTRTSVNRVATSTLVLPTQTPTPEDNYVPPAPEPTTTPYGGYPEPYTPAPEPTMDPYPDPKN